MGFIGFTLLQRATTLVYYEKQFHPCLIGVPTTIFFASKARFDNQQGLAWG